MALTLPGINKLRNAALVLRETTGYAYLPVFVPHEDAGRDALRELQRDSALSDDQWHQIEWPQPAADAALLIQRKALLESFDAQMSQPGHTGHVLVLDASPSTRHALAEDAVTYLNLRREQLRRHQRRLIVVWPAALSDVLMGGAPDLWSQRALSVVLTNEDAVVTPSVGFSSEAPALPHPRAKSSRPNPVVEAQLVQWFATHDLRRANLSGEDALTLAEVLYARRDFVESQLLAEAVENAYSDDDHLRSAGKLWHSLAVHSQGQYARALESGATSVEMFRRLSMASPAVYEPGLATSLNNLANFLSAAGDSAGALAIALEALEIRRRLAKVDPVTYEPDLAMSLNNVAGFQSETGDRAAALATALAAVEIYRRLALANPAAYEPDLAAGLHKLANLQSANGDRAGALPNAREAVEIYRRLAMDNAAAYEPVLARSLCVLAIALAGNGETPKARVVAGEALTLITPWAHDMPGAFAGQREAAEDLMKRFSVAS